MNLIHKPIITSMLDDDLYKFTTQMAILELFPDAIAKYTFINRGEQRFNEAFLNLLKYQIWTQLPTLSLTTDEKRWFSSKCPYLKRWYFDYLYNYRYNPSQVSVSLTSDNNLKIDIDGNWGETVLWEVKLMALVSELYFKTIQKEWNMKGQSSAARLKADMLTTNGCKFSDFGTRRRRNRETQDLVVGEMKNYSGLVGTSNVDLAKKYALSPIGTAPHEFTMAHQALEGIRNCNYYAMQNWVRVYSANLGIVLTDTVTLDQFLKNFNMRFSKLFDGTRCDSGSEFIYVDKLVKHYKNLKIDPMTKVIVFSNALNCEKAIEIKKYCNDKIKCSFGIGTYFSNSFLNISSTQPSPALNMVIKLWSINGVPVVKLSDDKGKVMGDTDAIKVTNWECFGESLTS